MTEKDRFEEELTGPRVEIWPDEWSGWMASHREDQYNFAFYLAFTTAFESIMLTASVRAFHRTGAQCRPLAATKVCWSPGPAGVVSDESATGNGLLQTTAPLPSNLPRKREK